ncbi:hypothetical protein H5410_048476 [Solanum commersonii]|uniref:Uncharacterized protein n=1 Tax=Solanum commersonii TaxID=4109 RepID=A0A9J5XJX8_SOLCO|nr:hypothetical protein H5410_048476 [Solanum commersonii]
MNAPERDTGENGKVVTNEKASDTREFRAKITRIIDMGIAKDVAELEVRHRMWGTIKKFLSSFKGYQAANISNVVVSRCAMMTQITDEGASTLG